MWVLCMIICHVILVCITRHCVLKILQVSFRLLMLQVLLGIISYRILRIWCLNVDGKGRKFPNLKFCLSGKAKEVYRSLPGGYQNNYELVKAQFTAMFGVVDDERSSALKLYSTKQREDQDLNSFIVDITLLANKAFPKDPLMANMRAKEAFLKGCKHRREAWVVINNGSCATFAEAVSLFKKVKILPYSGLNFSLRLNSKYLSDAKFLLFEPVEHPSVDILSVLTLPGSDLPVTIWNHTANTVTLRNGFVLGSGFRCEWH